MRLYMDVELWILDTVTRIAFNPTIYRGKRACACIFSPHFRISLTNHTSIHHFPSSSPFFSVRLNLTLSWCSANFTVLFVTVGGKRNVQSVHGCRLASMVFNSIKLKSPNVAVKKYAFFFSISQNDGPIQNYSARLCFHMVGREKLRRRKYKAQ